MSITTTKLGILGGGQLGRMFIQKAMDYNLAPIVLDPDPNAPCRHIASEFHVGSLNDFDTVYAFGKTCDIVTVEIENINTDALKKLHAEGIKVFPQPDVLEIIKDKRVQKSFYKDNNIPTAKFILTDDAEAVRSHSEFLPAVNKLGKEGYDGRGVQVLRTEEDLDKCFEQPSLLEELVDFELELSVIVARNEKGEIRSFPTVEQMLHPEHNLVEYLYSPAAIPFEIEQKARTLATEVIEKLGMVGLLAVELFLTKDGQLLVNEVAPRPHNSGHQTIEGNITSQYEQHLRAIMNLPLGSTDVLIPSAMVNLLGEDGFTGEAVYHGMEKVLAEEGVYVHLYGKKITKPFRKMGHVTIVDQNIEELKRKAQTVKETLKVKA